MAIQDTLAYLGKVFPGMPGYLQKYLRTSEIKFFTGSLRYDYSENLTDTVLIHENYKHMVAGIKTVIYYPFFQLVWTLKDDKTLPDLGMMYDSIDDVYNVIYDQLALTFPCGIFKEKKEEYLVLYNDNRMALVLRLNDNKPQVRSKLTLYRRHTTGYDLNECVRLTKEVKFNILGVDLTVKDYVESFYLRRFYSFLTIFHVVPYMPNNKF